MLIYWSFTARASKYFLSLWTISYVPPACFAECGFLRKLRQKIQAELLYCLAALHIRWLSWLSWYVIKCTEHCTCPSWPRAVAFKRKLNFDPGLMFPCFARFTWRTFLVVVSKCHDHNFPQTHFSKKRQYYMLICWFVDLHVSSGRYPPSNLECLSLWDFKNIAHFRVFVFVFVIVFVFLFVWSSFKWWSA